MILHYALSYADAFDIATALYMHAVLNHTGQGSREYAIHSDLEAVAFRPSPCLRDENDLSETEREIYDALVAGDLDIDHAVNRLHDFVHASED
jgi:hypothetical protein